MSLTLGTVATAAAVGLPLMLAAAIWIPGVRRLALAGAAWAALPALLLAVGSPAPSGVGADWLLFGMRLGVADSVARTFLLFTSTLWLIAGIYGRSYLAEDPRRGRFGSVFMLTLAGNLGVILATDLASFYFFYALMTFAAYGLVVHDRTQAARRAGRVYLVMALAGEMLLFTAFLLIVGAEINIELREVPVRVAASEERELLLGLLLTGFGVKAGAVLLHLWLPLAHPVAPTPASAVLSGAMIKAGLLGWLRFLPLGLAPLPAAGMGCLLAGFAAALYGVAIGLTQKEPKTILAYSSISQMGFMTAALGIGLANPEAAPGALTAILFYAVHHALAKGALFLGTGVARATGPGWPGRLVLLGLLLPALDLAGAPISSGALAKLSLTTIVEQSPWGGTWLPALLSAAAIGSTLLMISFLVRTLPREGARKVPPAGLCVPWALLLAVDLALLASPPVPTEDLGLLVLPGKVWSAAWPVCVGIALAAALRHSPRRAGGAVQVPAGDVLYFFETLAVAARDAFDRGRARPPPARVGELRARLTQLGQLPGRLLQLGGRAESWLGTFGAIGVLFLLLTLAATAVLLGSR